VSCTELTGWQVQAALHEALGCLKVWHGVVSVEQLSGFWQARVMRRYGVLRPGMKALQEVMAQAGRAADAGHLLRPRLH
jgi:hypothetical protein